MSLPAEQLEPEQTELTTTGPKVGMFSDISNEDYHRGPGISKSGLDLIDQSPAHYIEIKRHPKPSTNAMIIGSAFHCLVLEPEKFHEEYVTEPENAPRRPTSAQLNAKNPSSKTLDAIAFWSNWEKENAGKILISSKRGAHPHWDHSDWDTIHYMRDAVMSDPFASTLLDPSAGKAEQSVYWIDPETRKLCKCRPDFFNEAHRLVIDLKSTDDASYSGFAKSVAKWRYHVQDPFYRDGMEAAGIRTRAFVFIAVEKNPPYGVSIYKLDPKAVHVGRMVYQRNLETYAKCHANDDWPAYPEGIRDLEIPEWGLKGHIS